LTKPQAQMLAWSRTSIRLPTTTVQNGNATKQ
jgi:hypothetical protein